MSHIQHVVEVEIMLQLKSYDKLFLRKIMKNMKNMKNIESWKIHFNLYWSILDLLTF